MKAAVAVFSRLPVAGATKTRLSPPLTGEECAELHRRCLRDVCASVRASGLTGYLFFTGETPGNAGPKEVLGLTPEESAWFSIHSQQGADLGERMRRAAGTVLNCHASVLLVGSDLPDLTAGDLQAAAAGLADRDLVLGPAEDGGYYLLGLKAAEPALFAGVPWGSAVVLERTLELARAAGLTWSLLERKRDLDTWSDLVEFSHAHEAEAGGRMLESQVYVDELLAKYGAAGGKGQADGR